MALMRSLRAKVLLTVTLLVVGCGLSLSFLVTYWYSRNLYEVVRSEAERLAHQLALESTEKVLINDIVSLQKMIDYNMGINPALSYLFIVKSGQVQAHSFQDGLPVGLIKANHHTDEKHAKVLTLRTTQGDSYYDIAWPIFDGKGGVLRMGMSENTYIRQVRQLWFQIALITLGILIIAFFTAHLFIRKITRPLSELADAAEKIDEGKLDFQVEIHSHDEINRLGAAFNDMLTRIGGYTKRLESKTEEINRAYLQTRKSFEMLQQIGTQTTLPEVCVYMIRRFKDVVACQNTAMLILFQSRQELMVITEQTVKRFGSDQFEAVAPGVRGLDGTTFVKTGYFQADILPPDLIRGSKRLVVAPISHEKE